MAKSTIHSGWRRDTATNTLDLVVDGVEVTKYAAKLDRTADVAPIALYEDNTTQLYPLGTRLVTDERVFHYARAGAALNRQQAAGNNDSWSLTNEEPNASYAAGVTTIGVVNTTATKDLYAGGWVAIFTGRLQVRRIVGNEASDGTDTVLYLDGPLEEGITVDSTWVTGYPSIYYDTRHAASQYNTIVCVPNCVVASGSYYWGQTWGPCYMRAISTVPGVTAFDREVYFGGEGDAYGHIQAEGDTGGGYQRAGYLLPKTTSGGGDQFFMLQLTP